MSAQPHRDVAIIGMACVFPGAKNLQNYWENILHKVDAVSDPPSDWEAEYFFDEDSTTNDRTYCKRGGYLGALAAFRPLDHGIMPNSVDGTEPDHFLALQAASEALADAGYADAAKLKAHKERTAVIIGRGTYVNRGNTTAIQHTVVLDSVLRVLERLHPEHTQEELKDIRKELKASLPPFHADTAPGLVPNIISGRIANRLDLMGPNYIVDAACASSLVAVDLAMQQLLGGRCDMAIAGGVHASTPGTIMAIFSQLKALSRKGQIRPFDQEADGTLLGEGVGMLVLKRLVDAERDADRVYAVIKGVGTASDGRALGLLAPRLEGEELALRRAYENAGVDPASVELVEAHGTATPVGDVVEVEALNSVFGLRTDGPPRCALGSVKSMISHTMPASGSAGLIKTALALHHRVLPPTLHCDHPNPKLHLEKSNFDMNTESRPWIHGSRQTPRRAGVNAFGFGGINAHVVLEEYNGPASETWLQHQWDSELFVVTGATREEMLAEAQRLREFVSKAPDSVSLKDLAWTQNCGSGKKPGGDSRLAVVAASRPDLCQKLEAAVEKLKDGRAARLRSVEGIYYFREPLAGRGQLALVFPGEGAQYENMLSDLCMHFPEVRQVFDLMDRAFEGHSRGYLPSDTIFPPPRLSAGRLWSMDSGAEAVFVANQALCALVQQLGINADAMVGHSTGEHSALLAAGVVQASDEEELIRHIRGVNFVFESLKSSSHIPEGILLAVAGCDHGLLESLAARSEGKLHVALDNCPHQVVLCGTESAIDDCMRELAGKAAVCQKLPFSRAYHTPWFEVFSQPLRRYFDTAKIGPSRVALYSCVTAARYPDDPDQIRELTSVGWARTVRFRETIESMYRDGVRIFVEAGPRGNLTSFIHDILRGKSYLAVPGNVEHRSGILQMHHLLGQLIAHGVPVRLDYLYQRRSPQLVSLSKPAAVKPVLPLSGGLQAARLRPDFKLPQREVPAPLKEPPAVAASAPAADPSPGRRMILSQHFQTMAQFLDLQTQVMNAYFASRRGTTADPAVATGPFITEVLEVTPGVRARARHTFSLERELLFRDHTLGRNLSQYDAALRGLPIVPLTVTMEILAECGALLEPGKALVGMREFRAHRWITLDRPGVTIEISAEQREPGAVHVTLREAGPDTQLRPLWAEGLMLFDEKYPQGRAASPLKLEAERKSQWKPERLYEDGMFHGPAFQGVRSMNSTGKNGTAASLEVPRRDALFATLPSPAFLIDPVVLDAAGQVVAFWSQEQLDPTGDIFPYRLAALDCFAPPTEPGARLECRVSVKRVTDDTISSDIEIVGADGQLRYRLESWEDRRFPQSRNFWQLRISPAEVLLAEPWQEPIAGFLEQRLACCRIDNLRKDFFEASHGIWPKVLAHLVLSPAEREQWQSMTAVDKRRHEWLLGRCAAKDAVRLLVKRHFGVTLFPADVEIVPDAYGSPQARGAWTTEIGVNPTVSISHTHGIAVALASLEPGQMVGIDIETMRHSPEDFQAIAFSDRERAILGALDQDLRHEWSLRMWCAKEAVAKALGRGFTVGMQALRVAGAEIENGVVHVELQEGLQREFSQMRGRPMMVYTSRGKDLIFSTIVSQRGPVT